MGIYCKFLTIAILGLGATGGAVENLYLRRIDDVKVEPVIGTSTASNRLQCASACLQHGGGAYSIKKNADVDNCTFTQWNSDTFVEGNVGYHTYVPAGDPIPMRSAQRGVWGVWTAAYNCEAGSFVSGLKVWADDYNGNGLAHDDCGISGLKLHCKDQAGNAKAPIKFDQSFPDATARADAMCPDGTFARGFRPKWMDMQGTYDDDALTNLELICESGTATSHSDSRGTWFDAVSCPPSSFICGFKVKYEPLGTADDTCFNEVIMNCCFA